jgi:4-amino-4-deoxy-L-arabinose transferase-like glycosyltransferase
MPAPRTAGAATSCEPRRLGYFLVLIGFSAFGVFDHSLWAPNESRGAGMVWDMFRSGNWIRSSLNGAPFLEEPPLLHWTALFFCSLSGRISEGLVRLPAALYGIGTMGIVVRWGARFHRKRAGLLAAFLCATTLVFAEYSRIVLCDVCLAFMVAAALEAFWSAYSAERGRAIRFLAFLALTACAFYAKGVLGPGLVMASVVTFLALRREWKLALVLSLSFAPVLAAVVAPWTIALYRDGGAEHLMKVFVDNQLGRFFELPHGAAVTELPVVGRFLGSFASRPVPVDPYFVHKEGIFYYLLNLPVYLLPWTALTLPALRHWFRRESPVVAPFATFLRCSLVVGVVVLHVSSAKVACYALPLLPSLFLMVAVWCEDVGSTVPRLVDRWAYRITEEFARMLVWLLPSVFLVLLAIPGPCFDVVKALVPASRFQVPPGEPSAWLFGSDAGVVWRGAVVCAVALVFGTLALRSLKRRRDRVGVAANLLDLVAVLVVVVTAVFSAAMPIYDRQRSYKPVVELVRGELDRGREIALAVDASKDVGAFTFYADRRLPEVSLIPGALEYLRQGVGPRGVVIQADDRASLEAALQGFAHGTLGVPESMGLTSPSFLLITRN